MSAGEAAVARPGRRRLAVGVALAAVLVGAWAALGQLRESRALRRAWPVEQGSLVLDSLAAPVVVLRDRRGIPHAQAASEADALRALGFLHAQDRLGQMVWLLRTARGRAAELAGPAALAADRRARVLGIGRHADAQARKLDRWSRRALEAYSEGVNARIERIRSGRAAPPLLLERLGAELEPWRPADCLALVKLYSWELSGTLETSLVLEDLVQQLGGFAARPFFPDDAGIRAIPYGTEAREPARRSRPRALADPLRPAAGLAGPGLGSSAWVVSGRHSLSGRPLLAADIHLEAAVPGLYYEAHLRGGDLDVAGATLPGVPVFWIGRNRRLAWASVHARAVVADLFSETLDPSDPSRYHDGRGFRSLALRREMIAVRGADPTELVVRETRHGPLVNDLIAGEREPLALAWTGARTAPGIGGLLRVARAGSAAELREALARHKEPVIVVAYADETGEAGLQMAGWVPRRRLPSALVPVPGRARWYEWNSPVPADELPRAELGDGKAWLVAADNRLPGAKGSGIEWLWRTGERAARIDRLLREGVAAGLLDLRALIAIQGDLRSPRAPVVVGHALALAGEPASLGSEAAEVAALLRGWDGETSLDSVGAAVYHVFRRELTRELFAEPLGSGLLERYLALHHASPARPVAELLASAARGGPDASGGAETERVAEAVRRSLRATWLYLSVEAGPNREKWAWGRLHPLVFRPLIPGAAAGRALGPFPYPGDGASVAVGAYDPARSFETRVVSLYRFAVDLGEPGHVLSALVPGQSEHPGHRHRASGLPRWLEGRASLLATSPLLVEESAVRRLVLEPGP